MSNTAWYNQKHKELTHLRVEIHRERLKIDTAYRERCWNILLLMTACGPIYPVLRNYFTRIARHRAVAKKKAA